MENTVKKGLNSNTIKLIAVIAMTLDHLAWALYPGYPTDFVALLLHLIGRVTCPIMCYFIAEGYHYTKNIQKYIFRLFSFALIAHFCYIYFSADYIDWKSFIPFYYGKFLDQTSVMWSLAWGLVMLKVANDPKISHTACVVLILLICIVAFPADWSCIASLCVLAFGTNRHNLKKQAFWLIFYTAIYATVYFFCIDKVYGLLQMGVVLAIPIIAMYNGQRGKNPKINKIVKWLFYFYYPLHLLVIAYLFK
ncbi:MAG: TraX family protein [Erysipelotrichia bacterium]|nr:TraX family protein [Erysipelotrichia bacterium]